MVRCRLGNIHFDSRVLSTFSNMLEVGIGDLTTCTQLMDFCTVWLTAGKVMFTLILETTEYIQQYVRGRHW